MSLYAKANLFVGKYPVPRDGHIRLGPKARVLYLYGHEGPDGWEESKSASDELWLIVEDGEFWPVMICLDQGRDQRQP